MNLLFIPGSQHDRRQPAWYNNLQRKFPGFSVVQPEFPAPPDQNLANWWQAYQTAKIKPEETVLLAHSLGARLALYLMEQNRFAAAVLVAPPYWREDDIWRQATNHNGLGEVIGSFFKPEINWVGIKANMGENIRLLFSENDKLIPPWHPSLFYRALGLPVTMIRPGVNHFETDKGFAAIKSSVNGLCRCLGKEGKINQEADIMFRERMN